ncbi:MAG: hypothetical protein ACHQUC_02365 [Chlamydiales bacterium]
MSKLMIFFLSFFAFSSSLSGQGEIDAQSKPIKKISINLQEGQPPSLNPYVGAEHSSDKGPSEFGDIRTWKLFLYEP